HVSDISWTRRVNHPSEVLKKGMDVEAQVLEVDRENQRISVGIKQLDDDPWDKIAELYKIGDLVEGKVSKLASFGAFVGLDHDIDGLVHISQVSEERVEKIKDVLNVGEEVTARVIKIDRSDRRIGLSIKAANYSQEQLKEEEAVLDALKPGEDLVALQHAFDTFGDDEGESKAAAIKTKEEAGAAEEPEAPAETEPPTESEEAPAETAEEAPAEAEAKGDEAKPGE
ncbi:MAG: S1 RNA-binding domain-containing protein, partial [Verrucomicrobiota bacterium]|nr:S1 RNA-binding domain-containing protein [Verrucomicrobiota bacterium]